MTSDGTPKLRRAGELLAALTTDVDAWESASHCELGLDYSEDRRRVALTLTFTEQPPIERWGLQAGDVLHNLRSALDHALYGAAVRDCGADPPTDATKLQFPITDSSGLWNKAVGRGRLGPLKATGRAVVEAAQPWRTGNTALSLLRDLANEDKHRVLPLSMASLVASQVGLDGVVPLSEVSMRWTDGRLATTESTTVLIMQFDRPQSDRLLVNVDLRYMVALDQHAGLGATTLLTRDAGTGDLISETAAQAPGGGPSMVESLREMRAAVDGVLGRLRGLPVN